MKIFLYGPPGSGKSTIGSQLAAALNLPFIDLDKEIESITGERIFDIIKEKGEEHFRNLESALLEKAITLPDAVIALGGGALLREENRTAARDAGQIFFLNAELPLLLKRLAHNAEERPLLDGPLPESLEKLLSGRQAHYASFSSRVDASLDLAEIVWEIQRQAGWFHPRAMGGGYDVRVQAGGLEDVGLLMRSRGLPGPVLIVSDENVAPLYGERVLAALGHAGYSASLFTLPAGECFKTLASVDALWHACLQAQLERRSTILSLGGGVINDLAGFAAATYMRGCNWVTIPTTLLSMVDASIGGKTGFDLQEGKNLIGAFFAPRIVLADPVVLKTLPEREFLSGLAEVVKHGIIEDTWLFEICSLGPDAVKKNLNEVIRRAIAVKVHVIEQDPFEQGARAALNFGHTVGHALELISGFIISHGEAVAVGMTVEAKIGENLSITEKGVAARIEKTLTRLGLPAKIPQDIPLDGIVAALMRDKKKSNGRTRLAVPKRIGRVLVNVEVKELQSCLEEIR